LPANLAYIDSLDGSLANWTLPFVPKKILTWDDKYFDLTGQTLSASGAVEWYKNRTNTERNSIGFIGHAELLWLVRSEMHMPNFDCSLNRNGDCRGLPDLGQLRMRYPNEGDKNHVRILRFLFLWMSDQHDMVQYVLVRFLPRLQY
jgi:hypothetical protein